MDYRVKNGGWRDKAFKVADGLTVVPAGAEVLVEGAVELSEDQVAALAADKCEVVPAGAEAKPRGRTAKTED